MLTVDQAFSAALTLGALAHLLRAYPLRLLGATRVGAPRHLVGTAAPLTPLDLGGTERPLRWSLGPLAAYYVYGAYLSHALSSEAMLRRLAQRYAQIELLQSIEGAVIDMTRRRLKRARDDVLAYVADHIARLTPGDMLLLDGFVTALLRGNYIRWDDLAPLARISPITRIVRAATLAAHAGSPGTMYTGLNLEGAKRRPELLRLAEADEIPGVRQRMAQSLADACRPHGGQAVFTEAASTMRWIAFDGYTRVVAAGATPTAADYRVGLLIAQVYRLAQGDLARAGLTLADLAARPAGTDYLSGLTSAPLVAALFDASTAAASAGAAPERRVWSDPQHRRWIKEVLDAQP